MPEGIHAAAGYFVGSVGKSSPERKLRRLSESSCDEKRQARGDNKRQESADLNGPESPEGVTGSKT